MRSLVTSIFLYACESWTLTEELQSRIQATEIRCYRKILHISYKDHVTNKEVRAKIQQATGPHEDLLTTVKRCKLQWYGHVPHSSGLAKTILQGTVKGGRRQGRQWKRWENNIREWTGLEFAKSQLAVQNREKWRTQVAKSSVVPQRPSQLRDNDDDDLLLNLLRQKQTLTCQLYIHFHSERPCALGKILFNKERLQIMPISNEGRHSLMQKQMLHF